MRPAFLVELTLKFREKSAGFSEDRPHCRVYFPLDEATEEEGGLPLAPHFLPLEPGDLLDAMPADLEPAPLPAWIDEQREIAALQDRVIEEVIATESAGTFTNPEFKLNARAGEGEAAFRARCKEAVEAAVDEGTRALHDKVRREVDSLEARIRKIEAERAKHDGARSSHQTAELLNAGQTVLSWFTGRNRSLSSLADHRRKVSEAGARVEEADRELATLRRELFEIEEKLEEQIKSLRVREEQKVLATRALEIGLSRRDIVVQRAGILWVPVCRRL